jgi:hypothetical protein
VVRAAKYIYFCVIFIWLIVYIFVLFVLTIVMSVLLQITASDYRFGIFKYFLITNNTVLFVVLSYFISPLFFLSFDLQILITPWARTSHVVTR